MASPEHTFSNHILFSEDKPPLPFLTHTPNFKVFCKTGLQDKDKNFVLPITKGKGKSMLRFSL